MVMAEQQETQTRDEQQTNVSQNDTTAKRGATRRVKWTGQMLLDLQKSREKALELKNSEQPPTNANEKKKGYVELLHE